MNAAKKNEATQEEVCVINHRWINRLFGFIFTAISLLMCAVGWSVWAGHQAQKASAKCHTQVQIQSTKHDEQQRATNATLDRIETELGIIEADIKELLEGS